MPVRHEPLVDGSTAGPAGRGGLRNGTVLLIWAATGCLTIMMTHLAGATAAASPDPIINCALAGPVVMITGLPM